MPELSTLLSQKYHGGSELDIIESNPRGELLFRFRDASTKFPTIGAVQLTEREVHTLVDALDKWLINKQEAK